MKYFHLLFYGTIASVAKAQIQEICEDLPGFYIITDYWTGETQPCSWIDDAFNFLDVETRRQAQCSKPHVKAACKRACGVCCGDNKDHRWALELNNNETKKVTCDWLTRGNAEDRKGKYCELKQGSCPDACNECGASLEITPISENCDDNPYFKFAINSGNGREESCSWLTDAPSYAEVKRRRDEYCLNPEKRVILTACKRSCGTCIAAPDACEDDPDFNGIINAGNAGCSWIDSGNHFNEVNFRRKEQCTKPWVQKACPRACGFCCANNPSYTFNHQETNGNMIDVSCDMLADNKELNDRYCPFKKASCPESCGICPNQAPIPSVWKDSEDFMFENGNKNKKGCSWIDNIESYDLVTKRREKFCGIKGVKKNCKRACGKYCGDNQKFLFAHIDQNNTAIPVSCEWLSQNKAMKFVYCPSISQNCPETCGICSGEWLPPPSPPTPPTSATPPSPSPSPSPSSQPTESTKPKHCKDDPEFKFKLNEDSKNTRLCSWIDGAANGDDVLTRRDRVCHRDEVKEKCPRACGECCGNNKQYTFQHRYVQNDVEKDMDVTCDWLTGNEAMKAQYCDMKKLSCPDSCGTCPSEEDEETLQCEDDTQFRLPNNKPCSWIDGVSESSTVNYRREKFCPIGNVLNICRRACGVKCCGDNERFVFEYEGNAATCDWLSGDKAMNEKLCPTLKLTCPAACGLCPSTNAQVAGASTMSSANNINFSAMVLTGVVISLTALVFW